MSQEAKPPRDVQRYTDYLLHLKDAIALKDWIVAIGDDPPDDEGHNADVLAIVGRKRAMIRLPDNFAGEAEFDQRHTLTHELLHLHLATVDYYLEGKLSKSDFAAYCLLREYAVDGIADGVSHGFRLPSEIIGPAAVADDPQTP